MAKIEIQLSFNYDENEYKEFLKTQKLIHLKSHKESYIKVGDALRSEKGIIGRVVSRFVNYENLTTDYIIANNSVDSDILYNQFNKY